MSRALEARVRRLEKLIRPTHHAFILLEGQTLSPEQKARIRPGDSVYIRHIKAGYFPDIEENIRNT